MKKHRALEDTIERARHYGAMARRRAGTVPASPWKHALRDAVEFAVPRALTPAGRRETADAALAGQNSVCPPHPITASTNAGLREPA